MNGILVIDKPKDWTSRDVVNYISKKFNTKKIGHIGTLDPLATGVLVLCIGNALKLVEILMNHDKEYIAKIKLGIETDTLDITGNIINKSTIPTLSKENIESVLKSFLGKSSQEVPIYSSVKVNGKKLYEYARNGEKVNIPSKEIEIYNIELINSNYKDEFTIKCKVSKGTYIRSLVRDIGKKLKTRATLTELRRTSLGNINIEESYTLKDIDNNNYKLLSITDILNLPKIVVDEKLEKKIKNGSVLPTFFKEDMVYILNQKKKLLAIYHHKNKEYVKPYRMFTSE